MDRLLDEIESYWSTRTEGYSEVNEKELKGMQKKAWLKTLESGFLEKKLSDNDKEQLRILDLLEKRAAILNLRGWMPRPWSLRMRALM